MQKQSLQAYDRERDFSRERDLSRDDADRERDLSLSLSSFSRDLLLDSDFAFLLSRPPDLDLLLKKKMLKTFLKRKTKDPRKMTFNNRYEIIVCYLLCRDLDLLLSRLRLLLLSLGERDRDRDFDGERRALRPPREPDLDLTWNKIKIKCYEASSLREYEYHKELDRYNSILIEILNWTYLDRPLRPRDLDLDRPRRPLLNICRNRIK